MKNLRLSEIIRQHVIEEIFNNRLNILSLYGIPYQVNLKKIEDKGLFFSYIDNLSHVENEIVQLNNGLDNFFSYLSEINFRGKNKGVKLNVEILPAYQKNDLNNPLSPGIIGGEKSKVFVRLLNNINIKYECSLELQFVGYNIPLNIVYPEERPLSLRRNIKTIGNSGVLGLDSIVKRFPVAVNLGLKDKLKRDFCFYSDILRNELEPYTTKILKHRILKNKDEDSFQDIYEQILYDEKIIADSITNSFFLNLSNKNFVSDNSSIGYGFYDHMTHESQNQRLIKLIEDKGIQNLINLYRDYKNWDLENLIYR